MWMDVRAQWFMCVSVCVSVPTDCNCNVCCVCTWFTNKKNGAREAPRGAHTVWAQCAGLVCVCSCPKKEKKKMFHRV